MLKTSWRAKFNIREKLDCFLNFSSGHLIEEQELLLTNRASLKVFLSLHIWEGERQRQKNQKNNEKKKCPQNLLENNICENECFQLSVH